MEEAYTAYHMACTSLIPLCTFLLPDASLIESHDMDDMGPAPVRTHSPEGYQSYQKQQLPSPPPVAERSGGSASAEEAGAYNAMDFKHLNVSDEIRELFKYIGRYVAHLVHP